MQAQQFHVSYCYGSQENFLKALRADGYEEAEAILERVPHGITAAQKLERHVLLREGYCMLVNAYKNTASSLRRRLQEIEITSKDLEKIVAGYQILSNELKERGEVTLGAEDVYHKAVKLFEKLEEKNEKLKNDLKDYEELGSPEKIKEELRELNEVRNVLSS